jgi:hypothetical protein
MNPGIDRTEEASVAFNIPEGWTPIKSGYLKEGDKVLSISGWKAPSRLGTNAKVLIAVRRSEQ